jgi:hypothetical protein
MSSTGPRVWVYQNVAHTPAEALEVEDTDQNWRDLLSEPEVFEDKGDSPAFCGCEFAPEADRRLLKHAIATHCFIFDVDVWRSDRPPFTLDSLRALYSAYPNKRKICVLGNTGGGRDRWKRPEMGAIADETCAEVILTNEDPYDENPRAIVEEMAAGMKRAPRIIMNRREAIAEALALASKDDVVLVSGKGTDPYIMEANGTRTPWSDAAVVREELKRLIIKRSAS